MSGFQWVSGCHIIDRPHGIVPSKNVFSKKWELNFRNYFIPLYWLKRTFNFACMRRGDEIFSFLAKLTAFSQQLSGKLTISACLLIILLLVLDNCWNNLLLLYFPLLTRNAGEIFPSICMVKFRLCYYSFSGDLNKIELACKRQNISITIFLPSILQKKTKMFS